MGTTQQGAAESAELPLDMFCKDSGLMSCRSGWDDDATHLTFRCRTDKYFLGHMHPDVNSFELWGQGREWIIDPGKYPIYNDMHSTVLIDGVGGGGSLNWWTWPSLPGYFESYETSEKVVMGVGDAKPFYDYTQHQVKGAAVKIPGWKQPNLESLPVVDHGLRWQDFVYESDKDREMPYWRTKSLSYNFAYLSGDQPLYRYNPVKRARRIAALVRGESPYVVVVDDIQKDASPHRYTWIANVPRNGEIVVESKTASSMVLRHKDDVDGGPRLLVKLLACSGVPELALEEFVVPTTTIPVSRVAITVSNVVRPNFAVMLYPYEQGAEQPVARKVKGGREIRIGDQVNTLKFSRETKGSIQMAIE